jgi:hypothetical protein
LGQGATSGAVGHAMREAMDLGWRASSGAAVGRLRRRLEGGGGGREGGGTCAETA